jgi:uncharacterized cupin superfamily protein
VAVGVRRLRLEPGEIPTPEHVHPVSEEIFYVLAGSGLSRQDGKTYEIAAGDCIVHLAMKEAHTLRAGDHGLTVLAFGHRVRPAGTFFPNSNRYWLGPSWTEVGQRPPPYEAEPQLDWPAPGARPANIVHFEPFSQSPSQTTGLNLVQLDSGERGPPPHCHSAEEEIFVVLDGDGSLELWPTPHTHRLHPGFEYQEHPVRPGHVVARPPGTASPTPSGPGRGA